MNRTEQLLHAIHIAQSNFIAENPDSAFKLLLDNLLDLLDSNFGFLGFKRYNHDKPYIQIQFSSELAWNENELCIKHKTNPFSVFNMDTLFGEVIKTEKVIISNDTKNDPWYNGDIL